jgi:DNA-directed RNA polymerase subunit RPC12/RpoP
VKNIGENRKMNEEKRLRNEKETKHWKAGKDGKIIRCHHCGWVWLYRGKSKEITCCPRCNYNVFLKLRELKLPLSDEITKKEAVLQLREDF